MILYSYMDPLGKGSETYTAERILGFESAYLFGSDVRGDHTLDAGFLMNPYAKP